MTRFGIYFNKNSFLHKAIAVTKYLEDNETYLLDQIESFNLKYPDVYFRLNGDQLLCYGLAKNLEETVEKALNQLTKANLKVKFI